VANGLPWCYGRKNEKYILDHGISTGKRFPRNHAIMANLLRETLLDKFAANGPAPLAAGSCREKLLTY
jgi:hypothetical protein